MGAMMQRKILFRDIITYVIAIIALSVTYNCNAPYSDKIYTNIEKVDKYVPIMKRGGLEKRSKIDKILYSSKSGHTLTMHHLNAYCFQIDQFQEEISDNRHPWGNDWIEITTADGAYIEVIDTISGMAKTDNINWFPSSADVINNKYYIKVISINLGDNKKPINIEIMVYEPLSKKLYYADAEW